MRIRSIIPLLALAVLALGVLTLGCGEKGAGKDKNSLAVALEEPNVVVVDVRTEGEWKSGHIPGAVNLPLSDIANAGSVLKDKSAPVVVHCQMGSRSSKAKKALHDQGYTWVVDGESPEAVAKAMGVELQ